MSQGIVDQVGDHLPDSLWIGIHQRQRGWQLQRQDLSPVLRLQVTAGDNALKQIRRVGGLALQP